MSIVSIFVIRQCQRQNQEQCNDLLGKINENKQPWNPLTQEKAIEVEHATLSDSQLWYSLRAKRITASKFGDVAKRQSGFENLVKQLNPTRRVVTGDIQRGIDMEPFAAIAYANIAKKGKVNLFPSGLIINPVCPCLCCMYTRP